MFQLFEEQATSASQWVLFRSKRDNTTMKPGRKWVQVIKFHHFIVQNYEIPFQVLSSLAAALCQGACGHCVPLSAYVIPQVLHVNPQYRFQTPFPQRAQILYDVWLLVSLLMTQSYFSVGGELRGPAHNDRRGGLLVWWASYKELWLVQISFFLVIC